MAKRDFVLSFRAQEHKIYLGGKSMKHVASTWWLSILVLLCGCSSGEGTQNGPPPPNSPPPPQVQAYTVLHTFKEGAEGKIPLEI